MDLIVVVYDDWGIGRDGTQPVALSVDRKFFRETTRGAAVIAGRKTVGDFPGQKPLPGRLNIILTRQGGEYPGFTVCASPEEALEHVKDQAQVFVIGGGTVYRQMLPLCDRAYITKVHTTAPCDTWFPNLDELPEWKLTETLESGVEDGIGYEMCIYVRK